jgi:iron complex transport system permease protein
MRVRTPDLALVVVAAAILFSASIASIAVGAADLDVASVLRALFSSDAPQEVRDIVREIRLPRILGAIVVGGTLATVGGTLQAVMRNPLAEPYILGISSGASVGAAIAVVVFGLSTQGPIAALFAFGTAAASVVVVLRIAYTGGLVPPVRLLLAGVALSSFTSALTGFILYLAPNATEVRGVLFWLLGGLGGADWPGVLWAAGIALPACVALFFCARWQNLLVLGDESALSLGLDVASARKWLIGIAALAIGTVVAFSGAIGFVGLIVPHAVRRFVGPDHRRLLVASFLFGAILLVIVDAIARVIIAPQEVPVGLLTGLLGAPFFLGLLRRFKGEGEGDG